MITSFNEMNIDTFLALQDVRQEEGIEDIDRQVAEIAILTGKKEEDILNLPITEYQKLSARLSFLYEPYEKAKMQKEYEVGDYILVPCVDVKKMNARQFIDFQEIGRNGDKSFRTLLSVILVPKGKAYGSGYDVDDVEKAIGEHLTLPDGVAVYAFFLDSYNELIDRTLSFSERMAKGLPKKEREKAMGMLKEIRQKMASLEGGDGLR